MTQISLRAIFVAAVTAVAMVACSEVKDAETLGSSEQSVKTPKRVIVYYNRDTKDQALAELRNSGAKVHHDFAEEGAVSVTLPQFSINALGVNANIASIEEDAIREPYAAAPGQPLPYGVPMVEAVKMHNAGITGKGVKVCVIDTGYLLGHEDLPSGTQVSGAPGNLPWDKDGAGHGSHVAGTIAARGSNNLGVVGVAPDANLFIVRVFGDDGSWAYSSDLVAAARECEKGGAKVINMSLGGANRNNLENKTFADLLSKGILPIAAAGNDGNTKTSYPAGYASVISVAAIDANKAKATFSQANRDVELAAPGVAVWSTVPWIDESTVKVGTKTYAANHVEGAARSAGVSAALIDGGLCDAQNAAWSGKVVLCERGTVTFAVKVQNVQAAGGKAAIIFNNVPGGFGGTLGDGVTSTIVALTLSQEDGQAFRSSSIGASTTVASQITKPASGYEAFDGTSMACPHVAGVAALVMSACPSASASAVRTALQKTAEDLGNSGRDNQFGYGLVGACRAAKSLCGTNCN